MERIEIFRRADLACAELHYRLASEKMYEQAFLIPDAATKADVRGQFEKARALVDALTPGTPAEEILKRHFSDFLDGKKMEIREYFGGPNAAVRAMTGAVERCFENDSRADEEKVSLLLEKLAQAPDVLAAAKAEDCAGAAEDIRHYAENIETYLPETGGALGEELRAALIRLCGMLPDGKTGAAAAKDDESRCVPFTEAYYRSVLNDTLGVDLDELIAWSDEEIAKTRAAVFEIAGKLPVADSVRDMRDVNRVLNRYAGACDTPEEMFGRMQGYLDRAQAAAKNTVRFPEERCVLKGVPYTLRVSFPWGGYSDGDGRLRPITGTVFLNNYNFRAVTDGWMKMQAIHEAYPGHHIQYVRRVADRLPETLKLGAKYIPLIEGTAHRSESVFQGVFDEDPFFPLFVAYRRHHTAVRIRSDLMLRLYGRPIAECVKLYMDELDFDHGTARGQVLAQENMEGYFTCYYYGLKKITDFEKRYAGGAEPFTELLFSCGNISIGNLEAFLKLDEAQKQAYYRDYESLLTADR